MIIGSDQISEGNRRAPQGAGRFLVPAALISVVAHAGLAAALIQDKPQAPQLRPIVTVELVKRAPGSRTAKRVDGRNAGRATPTKAAKGSSASAAATPPAKTPVKTPKKAMAKAVDTPQRERPKPKPAVTAAKRVPTSLVPAAQIKPTLIKPTLIKPTQVAAIPPAAGQKTVQPVPQKTLAVKMRKPEALPASVVAKHQKPPEGASKPAVSGKPQRRQLALAAPTKPIAKRKTTPEAKKPNLKKAIGPSRKTPTRTKARVRKAALNSKRLTRTARSSRNARSQKRSQARSGAYAPPKAGRQGGINPIPHYPRVARKNGWQGRVLLAVSVGLDGRATSVRVRRSSGHRVLDQAALTTVRRWRFKPARRGAVAVAGTTVVPITFRLTR